MTLLELDVDKPVTRPLRVVFSLVPKRLGMQLALAVNAFFRVEKAPSLQHIQNAKRLGGKFNAACQRQNS